MQIGFFEIRDGEKKYLEERLTGHELNFSEDVATDEFLKAHPNLEVLSTHSDSKITADVINSLNDLKLIATRTTGFDHIDLKVTEAKGILVCNTPAYGETTVAEYAFALLLNLSRKVMGGAARIKENQFDTNGLQGFDLENKTIGVIGTGRIGLHAIKIANGFSMKVIAFDAYPKEELQSQLNFKYVPLEELLSTSDIITLHVPYLPSTHHLINGDNIQNIKKGCILINTARGAVVETTAILTGIEERILGGAGIDVFEEEPQLKSGQKNISETPLAKLLEKENVIITPHNAFNSIEAQIRILDTTIENIQRFQDGNAQNLIK